jgi:hypothetical protein
MSVDYYTCDCCGESIYEEYIGTCNKCGHRLCTDCLVNDDIRSSYAYDYGVKYDGTEEQRKEFGIDNPSDYKIGDIIDAAGINSKYCPYCNGKKIADSDLLEYLIKKYNLNKDDLKKEYLKNR